jgi:uncharacterized protein (DUF1501 family)
MPTGTFSDTKILVIMIKDGGEDSTARLRPKSTVLNGQINTFRPTLGFSDAEIAANTGGDIDADWNLHPSLNPLKAIWDANDMAITHRVGPMFTDLAPRTVQEVRASTFRAYTGDILHPTNLGAHDFQQLSSVSMITRDFVDQFGQPRRIGEGGFIGRLASLFAPFAPALGTGGTPSTLPLVYVCGVNGSMRALIHRSGLTRGLDIPVVSGRYNRQWVNTAQNTAFLTAIDALNALPQTEARRSAYRDVAEIMRQSVGFLQPVIETAYDGIPPAPYLVDQYFNNTAAGWEGILRTFARAIEARATGLGLPRRIVFIGNVSGYDTHFSQGKTTGALPGLFAGEAAAMASFRNAMINMPGGSLWNETLVTDWSEFSRTLLENGSAGTDHAWGRTCTAMGGAVIPGHYGTPPTAYGITSYAADGSIITPGGSHDVNGNYLGGGSVYPSISSEQYWGRILEWFGADANDLTAALPRRSSFGSAVALV